MISAEEAINKLRWRRLYNENKRTPVNEEFINNRLVDINFIKTTNLPYNPSVSMPPALARNEEMRIQQFKNDVKEVVEKVERETKKWSNLKEEEREYLKSLREKIEKKEVVCYITDKSGRWSCDTLNNYEVACKQQLEGNNKVKEIRVKKRYTRRKGKKSYHSERKCNSRILWDKERPQRD